MIDYLKNMFAHFLGKKGEPVADISHRDKKNQIDNIIRNTMEQYRYMANGNFYDYTATVAMNSVDLIDELM